MKRSHHREGGVAIVEAAFALPILFMFIMALVDLGLWSFNSNQAANAARDGARAGVLDYALADVPGSAAHDAILEAVRARLDRHVPADDVDVSCVDSAGAALSSCAIAYVDQDRIRVAVEWEWTLITPIAGIIGADRGLATGVATMTIVGKPVAGTPPVSPTTAPPPTSPPTTDPPPTTPCSISGITVLPHPVKPKANKEVDPVTIDYTTNGADQCNGLVVQLTAPSGDIVSAVCNQCEQNVSHKWTYDGEDKIWTVGTASVRIFNSYNDVSQNFTVANS